MKNQVLWKHIESLEKGNTGNTEGPGNTENTRKYLKPKEIFEIQGNTKITRKYWKYQEALAIQGSTGFFQKGTGCV